MATLKTFPNVGNGSVVFFWRRFVNAIELVLAAADAVWWNDHGFQTVNFLELVGFGVCCTGHATQLAVQTEVVLEGDGSHGLVFSLNGHTFFGFDRLVQAIAPAAARHETACELVHNDNLTLLHHIVLIAVVDVIGPQGCREVVHERNVGRIVKTCAFRNEPSVRQNAFGFFMTLFGQKHLV